MRREEKEALQQALQGLDGIVMTPSNDPKLSQLKADIRRAIEKRQPEKLKSGKASRRK